MTSLRQALVVLCTFTILFLTAVSQTAAGTWGFEGKTYPSGDVNCSGTPNAPELPSDCDMTSSGGARVTTSQWGDFCVASVWCGQTVHSCLASETASIMVHCWATGFASGAAYAQCKSDNGNWAVSCPLDLQSGEERAAAVDVAEETEQDAEADAESARDRFDRSQ